MEVLRTVNHLFLWAIYTMAMSNNQRVVNNIVYGKKHTWNMDMQFMQKMVNNYSIVYNIVQVYNTNE